VTLQFPNHSRSYDRTRQAVRFWGYDTSIEYSFFVTVDALERVEPRLMLHDVRLLAGHIQFSAAVQFCSGGLTELPVDC